MSNGDSEIRFPFAVRPEDRGAALVVQRNLEFLRDRIMGSDAFVGPPGPEGPPGPGRTVMEYMWEATAAEPPTGSEVRINNAVYENATKMWVKDNTVTGVDAHNVLMVTEVGAIVTVQDKDESDRVVQWKTTGAPVAKSGYVELPVVFVAKGPAALVEQRIILAIAVTAPPGPQGPPGAAGPPGPQGPAGPSTPQTMPARLDPTGPTITDCNTPKANGWYRLVTPGTNRPSGVSDYGLLLHEEWDGGNGHASQFFNPMYGGTLWWRKCETYAWQPWRQLYPIDDANLPARLVSSTQTASKVSDYNAANQNGWYSSNGGANGPPGGGYVDWANIYVASEGAQQVSQLAFPYWQDSVWFRRCHSGAWQAWQKIYPLDDTNLPYRLWAAAAYGSSDLNTFESGWSMYHPGAANRPNDSYGLVLTIKEAGNGQARQIAWQGNDFACWNRFKPGGVSTWSAWQQGVGLPPRLQPAGPVSANLNTITGSGWYTLQGGTNGPAGIAYVTTMHADYSGDGWYSFQIAQPLGYGYMWWRSCYQGTWGAWRQFYDTANPPDFVGSTPARIQRDTTTYGVSVSDWNSATQNGWYQGPPGTANAPDGSWYLGEVVAHRSDSSPRYITQRVWRFTDNTGLEYRRNCVGDAWSGWWQVGPPAAGFDTGWQGWWSYGYEMSGYGAPWGPPQYRKIGNVVYLRGLLAQAGAIATPTNLGALPPGYRPVGQNHLCVIQHSGGTCRLDIDAGSGNLTAYAGAYGVPDGWYSLHNISFPAS